MDATCGLDAELEEVPQLLRKAEQALKPPGFFGQLLGRDPDYDTAIQLLQQCGQVREAEEEIERHEKESRKDRRGAHFCSRRFFEFFAEIQTRSALRRGEGLFLEGS